MIAKIPHSRFNALAECDLEAKGYVTLTRSRYAGPDVFIKDEDLLEVFWQGHPEYDRDTLAREFRRDVLRYFNNEWPRPPPAAASAILTRRLRRAFNLRLQERTTNLCRSKRSPRR